MTTTEPTMTSTRPAIEDAIDAVAAERDALPRGSLPIEVGPARLDGEHCGPVDAAFVVHTGSLRLGDQLLTGLYLAEELTGTAQYPVREVVAWPDDRLHVEAEMDPSERGAFVPAGPRQLRLFASSSATFVLRSLHQRLSQAPHAPGLATPLLASVPARAGDRPGPVPSELGVILGPRDRREETLAGALQQLATAGHSVLFVCADNQALDRVVLAAHRRAGRPAAGTFLRVGLPSSEEVGHEPRLTINGATAAMAPAAVRRLHELASELRSGGTVRASGGSAARAEPEPQPATEPAGQARTQPAGQARTGPDARPGGEPPIAIVRKLERARRALATADQAVNAAVSAASAASAAHASARQAIRHLDEARTTYALVDELARRVEAASADTAASAAGVGRLAGDSARARQLLVAVEVATVRLDRRDAALDELDEATRRAQRLPFGRADVARADQELSRARTAHAAAERAALRARADRARAAKVVGELARELADASPTAPDDRAADARRPVRDAAVRRNGTSAGAARLTALRAEYGRARAELASQQRAAIQGARVVAATFAQLVANPAIYERVYDNVIVEQAGSAPAAFLLWAATCARALTLATEPGERPPTPAVDVASLPRERSRWLSSNLLELVGLDRPEAVANHASGLILA